VLVSVHHHVPGRTRLRLERWPHASDWTRIEPALARRGWQVSASVHARSLRIIHDSGLTATAVVETIEALFAGRDDAPLPAQATDAAHQGGLADLADDCLASPADLFAPCTGSMPSPRPRADRAAR
jgi:hypothetical protein